MAGENTKTIRIIKLAIMLMNARSYSADEIAERLAITRRTVFRDLEDLERIGFVINRNNGRYKVDPDGKSSVLHSISTKESLSVNGFSARENIESGRKRALKIVDELSAAIRNRKRIRLLDYRSAKGISFVKTIEPFSLAYNDQTLWAWDAASRMCKQFKVMRMQGVEVLDDEWQFEHKHKLPFTDIFNLSSVEPVDTIKLQLNDTAYNLLTEEFPGSLEFLKDKKSHLFIIPVADYRGAGRFVLGLMDAVTVLGSVEFKRYLREMVRAYGKFS